MVSAFATLPSLDRGGGIRLMPGLLRPLTQPAEPLTGPARWEINRRHLCWAGRSPGTGVHPVQRLSLYAIAAGALALAVALILYLRVKAAPEGNEQMQRIARYIRDGAMAFLGREYKVLAVYAAVVSSLLF